MSLVFCFFHFLNIFLRVLLELFNAPRAAEAVDFTFVFVCLFHLFINLFAAYRADFIPNHLCLSHLLGSVCLFRCISNSCNQKYDQCKYSQFFHNFPLSFKFFFHDILYFLHRITLLIKLGSPQGFPETNISHCRMVVNIAAQKTLVLKDRRFFTHAVTVDAV